MPRAYFFTSCIAGTTEVQTRLSAVRQLSLRDGTSVSRRREKRPMAEGQEKP